MAGLDLQLLHYTCCVVLHCFTSAPEQGELGQGPRSPFLGGKRWQATLEGLQRGFARKVYGLWALLMFLAALATVFFSVLPEVPLQRAAKGAGYLTCLGITVFCWQDAKLQHSLEQVIHPLLGLVQAAVLAPAVAACPLWGVITSLIVTALAVTLVAVLAWRCPVNFTSHESTVSSVVLATYPLGLPLSLVEALQTPATVLTQSAEAGYGVICVCGLVAFGVLDLQRVTRLSCCGAGFGLDSAHLAAGSLCLLVLHAFLRCLCLVLTVSGSGEHKALLRWDL